MSGLGKYFVTVLILSFELPVPQILLHTPAVLVNFSFITSWPFIYIIIELLGHSKPYYSQELIANNFICRPIVSWYGKSICVEKNLYFPPLTQAIKHEGKRVKLLKYV